MGKLKHCAIAPNQWKWTIVGHVQRRLCRLEDDFKNAGHRDGGMSNSVEVRKIEKEINSLLEWDEVMWHHRFRQDWLKHRDKNSRFFH